MQPETLAPQPQVVVNPGETLRLAREQRRLSITDVAERLNLTPGTVRHIEAGDFGRLPGHTFARGYVRTYARLMELDQAELVTQFDRFTGTDATGAEVRNLSRIQEPRHLSRTILRVVSALLLILLIGMGYYVWQETPDQFPRLGTIGLRHIEVEKANGTTEVHPIDDAQPVVQAVPLIAPGQGSTPLAMPSTDSAQPVDPAQAPQPVQVQPVSQPAVIAAPAVGVIALPQPTPVAPAPVAGQPAAESVAATGEAAATPAPEVAPAPEVPEGHGLVQASFSADCWLQITDARGKVVFSGVKRQGEALAVTGRPPLQVHLGNAAAAALSYNGQPVEKGNVGSGGTARLKLGQ